MQSLIPLPPDTDDYIIWRRQMDIFHKLPLNSKIQNYIKKMASLTFSNTCFLRSCCVCIIILKFLIIDILIYF